MLPQLKLRASRELDESSLKPCIPRARICFKHLVNLSLIKGGVKKCMNAASPKGEGIQILQNEFNTLARQIIKLVHPISFA
jgi:hypothetical protein